MAIVAHDLTGDAKAHVEKHIFTEGKAYGETVAESHILNNKRAESRERLKKAGVLPSAFGHAAKLARNLTPAELEDWIVDFTWSARILIKAQAELFPEDAIRIAKREAVRKAAAAKAADPNGQDKTAPDSPRGDPAKGGAGGVDGKKAAKDAKPKAVEPAVTKRKPGRPRKGGDNVVPIGAKKAGKIDVVSQSGVTAAEVPLVADDVQEKEQAEGGKLLDDAVEGIKEREAEERAAFSDLTGTGDEPPPEDGDALIKRVAAQKMAELDARGGMDGMAPIDASGDDEPVDKNGLVGGKTGLGSVSDEVPLSQSAIAAQKLAAAGLN